MGPGFQNRGLFFAQKGRRPVGSHGRRGYGWLGKISGKAGAARLAKEFCFKP